MRLHSKYHRIARYNRAEHVKFKRQIRTSDVEHNVRCAFSGNKIVRNNDDDEIIFFPHRYKFNEWLCCNFFANGIVRTVKISSNSVDESNCCFCVVHFHLTCAAWKT